MSEIPPYLWPLISLVGSVLGSWAAVKVSIAKLEVEMKRAIEDIRYLVREVDLHGEDIQAHDMELEQALNTLKLKRARRQPLRGRDK